MSVQETPMQIGDVLEGRYRVVSEATGHDLGTAYKAYDTQQDRLVAVLLLARRLGRGSAVVGRLREAQQAIADLAEPGLVPFTAVGQADEGIYLVRDRVPGHTLADLLGRAGRVSAEAAVEITIRLCEALAPLHRAGLIHGGLAPATVWLAKDGQVSVTGAALRPTAAKAGKPWGRTPYLSPEQAAGEMAHPASDVYAIGLLLYEMLAGRRPFEASEESELILQHLRREPPPLRTWVPDLPPPLAQIVHKALAKEPAARYRNAGQLAHILRSQLKEPEEAPPAGPAERFVVPAPVVERGYEPRVEPGGREVAGTGVDWLMVVLFLAALAAILGLIPLWRTVYQRYSPPQPDEAGFVYRECTSLEHGQPLSQEWTELGDFGLVWYNSLMLQNPGPAGRCAGQERVKSSTTAGACSLWESSLRVSGARCITL